MDLLKICTIIKTIIGKKVLCMIDFSNVQPLFTPLKNGRIIKRYNVKLKQANSDANISVGATPSGSVYYKKNLPDKTWATLYMVKHDGSELIVDTYKSNDHTKAIVEKRNKGIVTGGAIITRYNGPGAKNTIAECNKIGKLSNTIVTKDAYMAINDFKKSIDISDLKPRVSKFKKFLKQIFK